MILYYLKWFINTFMIPFKTFLENAEIDEYDEWADYLDEKYYNINTDIIKYIMKKHDLTLFLESKVSFFKLYITNKVNTPEDLFILNKL